MMVPFALVLRRDDETWKSVVEPMLLILKRVEVAPELVVEESAKSVVFTDVDAAWSERSAYGEVVPRPRFPVEELKMNCVPFALPKRTVLEACKPFVSSNVEEVAEVSRPKLSVGVNG